MGHKLFGEWSQPHDNGNGALRSRRDVGEGVYEVSYRSYSRREKSENWFAVDGDPQDRHYKSRETAVAAARSLRSISDAAIMAEVRRRKLDITQRKGA